MTTRIILLIVFLSLFLNDITAQIYQYDHIIFYPNGSQYIHLSKLYVGNLGEMLKGEVLEAYVIYKNQSFFIYQVYRNITFDLPVERVNLSVKISATKIDWDSWKVTYTVINNYDREVPVNISFPPGYNLKNISTVIPGHSHISIDLYKRSSSNTLYFEDSYISYQIPSKVEIIYSPSIPFSIEKSNKVVNNTILWIGNYTLYNNIDVPLNANIYLWVEVDNRSINLGNISNIFLPPNSTYSVVRSIYSEEVPVFYLDMYVWNRTEGDILVLPVLKLNNTYVIGVAKVKGEVFHYTPPSLPGGRIRKPEKPDKEEKPPEYRKKPEEDREEKKEKPPEENKEEKEKPTGKTREEREGESNIERERTYLIKKIDNPRDAAILSLSIFILNIVALILLPLYLPPNIVDDTGALIHAYRSVRKIYVPEGIELKGPLPLNIYVVRPRDSLVSLVSRTFNIPVNSAKALVTAIEHGGILKTGDRRTYEIALKLGIDVEFVE
ncbi:MAG TPA: hypothetical protein EYP47_02220 [Methanococcaceae archaeon]|nr:hypothetical protein [Methanococcaceae archaeon]